MPHLSRRAVLLGGLAGSALAALPRDMKPALAAGPMDDGAQAPVPNANRIVSMDFALAETLIELGAPPIAIPNPAAWADWVGQPLLPPDIVNLGTDREPNLELLAMLKPDLIVTTPYLDGIRPLLERFAPTRRFSIYTPPVGHPYERSVVATRQMAAVIGREQAGEVLIARARTQMEWARDRLRDAGVTDRPLLVVQLLDTRHIRIYGGGSLLDDVMVRCGLTNGWGPTGNFWGFNTIGIEQLARMPSSRLIYLEPVSPDTLAKLAASPLWNSLPFVRSGDVVRLPTVLTFGMLPSAMRFASLLVQHLADGRAHG